MADIEKSIAACCKQLKLSTNFAGQAFEQKGDTPQEYLQIPVDRCAHSRISGAPILK